MAIHDEHESYYRFTAPSRLDKAVNSLLGIFEGLTADLTVNDHERRFLEEWLATYSAYRDRHPFVELLPALSAAVIDGVLDPEEHADLVWLCERLRSHDYYDTVTADMQRLHAQLGAIAADGSITREELKALSAWLSEHEHLRRCWPYDEIDGIVLGVLSDGRIDAREHATLLAFFSEFLPSEMQRTMERPFLHVASTLQGVCAACPEITFKNALFCFTGASDRLTRHQFAGLVESLGGQFTNRVTRELDYLVIGAEGNPCWSYACYGRKVEKCIDLRRQGARLLMIHENDFFDAVADAQAV